MDGRVARGSHAVPTQRAPHETRTGGARPNDTSADAWDRLAIKWASMSPAQRAALAAAMSTAIETAARAGVRASEPDADDARVRFLVAQRRYGTEVAEAAFGIDGRWPQ